jgi:hypothetical protein
LSAISRSAKAGPWAVLRGIAAEAPDAFGQQLEKALPIGLGEENVLAAVARSADR